MLGGCVSLPKPKRALPPAGDLALSASAPIVAVRVGGVEMRLRVDPGQWEVIELNAATAARLTLPFIRDHDIAIGRVTIDGRTAQTVMEVAGRTVPVLVADHGKVAAVDADGLIGPDLLPYESVEWRNPAAPAPNGVVILPVAIEPRTGLSAVLPALGLPIRLRFSLVRDSSEATAAAGSMLLKRFGGAFAGPAAPVPVMFGVTRPERPVRFVRAPLIAGFRFETIGVRISDFRGDNPLPEDQAAEGEILVTHHRPPQAAEPWVLLGRDRLGRCAAIRYAAAARTLRLDCAFDR